VKTSYELVFDPENGKFKEQEIIAEVLRGGFDAPCEIERGDVEFPEDVFGMTTGFAPGDTAFSVEVFLKDEIYSSEDFLSVLEKDFEFIFNLTPREYDDSGSFSLAPPVRGSCHVKCGEVPSSVEILEPTKEALPIPACGDEVTQLLLKVTMGEHGPPRTGLKLRWERVDGGCSPKGKLEAVSEMTDGEGCFRLSYTAPKLYYKEGRDFFEEYRFFDARSPENEIFRLKIPLAPGIVFKITAEKVMKLDGADYGIVSELSPLIEIDAGERVKTIEGELKIRATAQGEEKQFAVGNAECKLLLGDEEGLDEEQQGVKLRSTAEGRIRWEIPELGRAFGDSGRTYTLFEEDAERPELKLSEAAEKAISSFETLSTRSSVPRTVFEGELWKGISGYRLTHCEQLAREEPQQFRKIRESMDMLGVGVRYVVPFHGAFSEQFAPLLGVVGDTFWDVFNIIWNVGNFAGKIFSAIGTGAEKAANAIVARMKASPGYFKAFLSKINPLASAMSKAASFVEWIAGKLDGFGGFLAKYLPKLQSFSRGLGKEISEIMTLWKDIQSTGMKVLAGLAGAVKALVMMVADAVRTLFECLASLLKKLAFFLLRRVGSALQTAERVFLDIMQPLIPADAFKEAFRIISEMLGHPEKVLDGYGQGLYVQLGNLLQGKVEEILGKGAWTGGAADRAVSGFASMKFFDPGARRAVGDLYSTCRNLRITQNPEEMRKRTTQVASAIKDLQLQYEIEFIYREAIRMFLGSMKIPVEIALAVVVGIFSLGTGTGLVLELCTGIEVMLSAISIRFVNGPHAVGIFIGAYVVLQAYLSVIKALER